MSAGQSDRKRWFSNIHFVIPFGRYIGDRRREADDEGLLIGRLKQRATLIGALLHDTYRGAILVTGHRGSGKTSLVDHCLAEYEASLYERYINRNVGKQFLWDGVVLAVFVGLVLTGFALLHAFLAILVRDENIGPFVVVTSLVVALVLAQPLLPASAAIRVGLARIQWRSAKSELPDCLGNNQRTLVTATTVVILVVAGGIIAWYGKLIVENAGNLHDPTNRPFVAWILISTLLALILAATRGQKIIYLISASLLSLFILASSLRNEGSIAEIFALLGLIMTIYGKLGVKSARLERGEVSFETALAAIPRRLVWIGIAVSSFAVLSHLMFLPYERIIQVGVVCVSTFIVAACPVRHPKSFGAGGLAIAFVLLLKALTLAILAVQLISPALYGLLPDFHGREILSYISHCSQRDLSHSFLSWLLYLIVIIFLLARLEFEAICRHSGRRLDVAMRLDQAETNRALSQAEDRTYQRRLFRQTFFFYIFRHWLPILVIPVNLGLDSLDHRRVMEAMLTRLRDEYSRAFCSVGAPINVIKSLLKLGATIVIGLLLSYHLFSGDTDYVGREELEINSDKSRDPDRQVSLVQPDQELLTKARIFAVETAFDSKSELVMPGTDKGHGSELVVALANPKGSFCIENAYKDGMIAPGAIVLCWFGGEPLARLAYSRVLPRSTFLASVPQDSFSPRSVLSIVGPLGLNEVLSVKIPDGNPDGDRKVTIVVRFYHVVCISLAWLLIGAAFSRLWPYTKFLRRMDLLLLGLSSRTRQDAVSAPSLWTRIFWVIFGRDIETMVEAEPLDPRTVETAALRLLAQIQEHRIRLPFWARNHFSLPAPEVIFKFDELDKLGAALIPNHNSELEIDPNQGLEVVRRRNQAIHNLLADLKNLIGSGVARFIFIGGKNLHDEWLADLGDRQPLMTNVFAIEIHLPSLLTESLDKTLDCVDDTNIRWYLLHLHEECRLSLESAWPPSLSTGIKTSSYQDSFHYAQRLAEDSIFHGSHVGIREQKLSGVTIGHSSSRGLSDNLFQDLIDFLCYRSRGNPRRLRMLVEAMMEQKANLDHEFHNGIQNQLSGDLVNSDHVMVFRETDRFRIQLIAEVYRRFNQAIGQRFSFRDDKLIVGALHLSDFLLKFHRRSFGFSSLQRVDELVHIFRSPDLPSVLSLILNRWSGRYLHGIRNGMYDFRFSSEFSQELRYLSRRSEEELAALNFTLDESQELKTTYRARIEHTKDESNSEFFAALGELHEFDEEHELARFNYFRALAILDRRMEVQIGSRKTGLFQVLKQTNEGLEVVRRRITWALARLRINLQIGMTFERGQDLERAQAYYRSSRSFAATVIRGLLNASVKKGILLLPAIPDKGLPDFPSTLKHLNLLFQPAFAEAWVAEKINVGVDTGMRILERSIWELRWTIPTVGDQYDAKNKSVRSGGSRRIRLQMLNFYLTMSEAHNKTADLLFYKASPRIVPIPEGAKRTLGRSYGFLGSAHYHYAIAIHEVHSYLAYRQDRNLRLPADYIEAEEVSRLDLEGSPLPIFVSDAIAELLADCGDALLARVSLVSCLKPQLDDRRDLFQGEFDHALSLARQTFDRWMRELPGFEVNVVGWGEGIALCFAGQPFNTELRQLLGQRCLVSVEPKECVVLEPSMEKGPSEPEEDEADRISRFLELRDSDTKKLLELDSSLTGDEALANYLLLLSVASSILEDAGRPEDAARRQAKVVEVALTFLQMARIVSALSKMAPASIGGSETRWRSWSRHFGVVDWSGAFIYQIASFGVCSANRAISLYLRARHDFLPGADAFSLGRSIPTSMGIQLCCLGLHAGQCFGWDSLIVRQVASTLLRIFDDKGGKPPAGQELAYCEGLRTLEAGRSANDGAPFLALLEDTLVRNVYPLLGRLCGLKGLLDHQLLSMLESGMEVGTGSEELSVMHSRMGELNETVGFYDSPRHFTPFMHGTTQALYAFVCRELSLPEVSSQEIRSAICRATETLEASVGMYTMRKEFYESISGLYYLYDDFNDRRFHFNHALQMSGGELTQFMLAILEAYLEEINLGLAEGGAYVGVNN